MSALQPIGLESVSGVLHTIGKHNATFGGYALSKILQKELRND